MRPHMLEYNLYSLGHCFGITYGKYMCRMFQSVAVYCFNFSNLIPVSFVLGFYVSIIFRRFWSQFSLIPWPTNTSTYIAVYLQGDNEGARLMRRTIIRYVCLSFVLTMMSICAPVKKRFPSLTHVTEAGE